MHRLAQILGTTTLVGLVAACGNAAAAPAGPASPTAAPAASAGDAPSSALPTSQPVKAAHTDLARLTIDPDHIGPLKIGMSLGAAKATGLIVVNPGQGAPGPDTCVSAHWKGQSDSVWMVFNGKYGLRALDSFGNQKTAEGIKPGSTLAAVRQAYPNLTWRLDGDETSDAQRIDGDALVDAVKGDGAHYRITIRKGKVTDVQLESDQDGCYE
jgi:hypothetical protein